MHGTYCERILGWSSFHLIDQRSLPLLLLVPIPPLVRESLKFKLPFLLLLNKNNTRLLLYPLLIMNNTVPLRVLLYLPLTTKGIVLLRLLLLLWLQHITNNPIMLLHHLQLHLLPMKEQTLLVMVYLTIVSVELVSQAVVQNAAQTLPIALQWLIFLPPPPLPPRPLLLALYHYHLYRHLNNSTTIFLPQPLILVHPL